MKRIKRITFGTTLLTLYGEKSYSEQIRIGRTFFFFFDDGTEQAKVTGKSYNKILITFIRSGVVFYAVDGIPNKEYHFALNSFMARNLEMTSIDPEKELKHILLTKEDRIIFRFDDTRTKIINYNNDKEIDVEDSFAEAFNLRYDSNVA